MRLVAEANAGRIPELIPLRHGRMLASPFTFYRGTALNMAVDLAGTPTTGFRVQACGDAHLGNFRCFATPERRVIFDIHDLDETLPAPWEWDVKRLAASFVLACRANGFSDKLAREAVLTCARSYRRSMARFSTMRALDVWYASFEAESSSRRSRMPGIRARTRKLLDKAKSICMVEDDFPKLADTSGETPTIKDDPPSIYHHLERGEDEFYAQIAEVFSRYRESLPDDRRVLLDRYAVKDKAIKVVGVGQRRHRLQRRAPDGGREDPLFLQVKEARPSVLEAHAGTSVYANQGQRVVKGHRLMQSASDIFLGWTQRQQRPALLRPPAPGHEAQVPRREVQAGQDDHFRRLVRGHAGARPRPLRRTGRDQPATSASPTRSTKPSRPSRSPTPIRSSAITRASTKAVRRWEARSSNGRKRLIDAGCGETRRDACKKVSLKPINSSGQCAVSPVLAPGALVSAAFLELASGLACPVAGNS